MRRPGGHRLPGEAAVSQTASKLLCGWAESWVLGKPLPTGEGKAVFPEQLLAQLKPTHAGVKTLPHPENQVTVAWVQLLQRLIW